MKIIYKLFLILTCSYTFTQNIVDYGNIIQESALTWQHTCLEQLSPQEIIIMADMLLLSYQVVQASVIMSQARLTIQEDLLKIVTLSINDSFDARIQAQSNDLSSIKNEVCKIEQAQEQIKSACDKLQSFGPIIIAIDPAVIQIFILNLKKIILKWSQNQADTLLQLDDIQKSFYNTAEILNEIKIIFQTIIDTDSMDHSQLLHGTNNLTNMYNSIEDVLKKLTCIRQNSLISFNTLFDAYFKMYYQALYNQAQHTNSLDMPLFSDPTKTLSAPDKIFA